MRVTRRTSVALPSCAALATRGMTATAKPEPVMKTMK
jgi:hypothetical protein